VVFVVLVMPFAFLGVLFSMDIVENWVVREPPVRPDVTALTVEQRRSSETYDPPAMVSRGAAQQSV
jgi:hypothetical protein